MGRRLLIVEDERKIRNLIRDYFEMKGYEVLEAEHGREALEITEKESVDIVFLDVMMSGMDGMMVCQEIRKENDMPIIFLTALYDEESKLKGYSSGADDYVTKPFSLEILWAKSEALLKRYKRDINKGNFLESKGLKLDIRSRILLVEGKEVFLAAKEFDILQFFLEHKEQVISREQILDRVWGEEYYGYDRTVDTHIKKLRKAIGDSAKCLQTIYKAGYIWKE